MTMGAVFISYRRDDRPGSAQAIYLQLEKWFGAENVFMDVDDISPGEDFPTILDNALSQCQVVLAVIGPDWLDIKDEQSGSRRLDLPDDFVRREIVTAMDKGVQVIPVLVANAAMPKAEHLPDALKPIASLNAGELRHGRFKDDLANVLKEIPGYAELVEVARQKRRQRFKDAMRFSVSALGSLAIVTGAGVTSQAYRYLSDPRIGVLSVVAALLLFSLINATLKYRRRWYALALAPLVAAVAYGTYLTNDYVVFGPADSIGKPSIVFLVQDDFDDADADRLIAEAIDALPGVLAAGPVQFSPVSIQYHGPGNAAPESSRIWRRLIMNPYVRGVVSVVDGGSGIRVHPALAEREFWGELGADTIDVEDMEESAAYSNWQRIVRFGHLYLSGGFQFEWLPYSYGYSTEMTANAGFKEHSAYTFSQVEPYDSRISSSAALRTMLYSMMHYVAADSLRLSGRADLACQLLEDGTRNIEHAVELYESFEPLLTLQANCKQNQSLEMIDLLNALETGKFNELPRIRDVFASHLLSTADAHLSRLSTSNRTHPAIAAATQLREECSIATVGARPDELDFTCLETLASEHSEAFRSNDALRVEFTRVAANAYMLRKTRASPSISEGLLIEIGASEEDFCDDLADQIYGLSSRTGVYFATARYDARCSEFASLGRAVAAFYRFMNELEFAAATMLELLEIVAEYKQPSLALRRARLDEIEPEKLRNLIRRTSSDWRDRLLVAFARADKRLLQNTALVFEWLHDSFLLNSSLDGVVAQLNASHAAIDTHPVSLLDRIFLRNDSQPDLPNLIIQALSRIPLDALISADEDQDGEWDELAAQAVDIVSNILPQIRDPAHKAGLISALTEVEDSDVNRQELRQDMWQLVDAYPEQWMLIVAVAVITTPDDTDEWLRLQKYIKRHTGGDDTELSLRDLNATALEAVGDHSAARSIFSELAVEARSLLRTDYYNRKVMLLDRKEPVGENACFTINGHTISEAEMKTYAELSERLDRDLGKVELPLHYAIAGEAEDLAVGLDYEVNGQFSDVWSKVLQAGGDRRDNDAATAGENLRTTGQADPSLRDYLEKLIETHPGLLYRVLRDRAFAETAEGFSLNQPDDDSESSDEDDPNDELWRNVELELGPDCAKQLPAWFVEAVSISSQPASS